MTSPTTKRRLRRLFNRRRKQVEVAGSVADDHFEKHFIRRFVRLGLVRRFILGWLGLVLVLLVAIIFQIFSLNGFYQQKGPVAGGIYNEGIIGAYKNSNPIYASGIVDNSVSRLIFAGLLKYNESGELVNDLADKMTIDQNDRKYTIHIKKNAKWHDGKPVTARDVLFTIKTIQNPEVGSPLRSSWRGVEIVAKNDQIIEITLQNIYGPFARSLTVGILPEHILKSVPPNQLRSHSFNNIQPVGSGPYALESVEVIGLAANERTERIGLRAFEEYHLGKPNISQIVIRTFLDQKMILEDYKEKKINAMVGLQSLPDEIANDKNTNQFPVPLAGEVMVFFRNSNSFLKDKEVRRALVLATDKDEIIKSLGYDVVPAASPLLPQHNGYNRKLVQKTGNKLVAEKMLDKKGWKKDPATGIRKKGGVEFKLKLVLQNNSEFARVSEALKQDWLEVGVISEIQVLDAGDFQTAASLHNYDALLTAISIGPDPDVFPYWHSSQADARADNRLNFSEYNSVVADRSLEAGRSRTDLKVRGVKYEPFLKAWLEDSPALALYQPRFLYVARDPLYGFSLKSAESATDRLNNIHQWMVREALVPKKDPAISQSK